MLRPVFLILALLLALPPGCARETSRLVVALHPRGVSGADRFVVSLRLDGQPALDVETFPGDRGELDLQLPDEASGVLQVDLRALDCHGCALGQGEATVILAGLGRYDAELPIFALPAPACPSGKLQPARALHAAVLLTEGRDRGKVLVLGGMDHLTPIDGAELFDPQTQTGEAAGAPVPLRYSLTVSPLSGGRLLVAGGENAGAVGVAEIYDPQPRTFRMVAPLLGLRAQHAAVTLPDGRVLVAGGHNGDGALRSAEVYDPMLDRWSPAGEMKAARAFPTATLLPGGKVLVAGGADTGQTGQASAEIFDPAAAAGKQWSDAGQMSAGRYQHQAVLLPDGSVLVVGGYSAAARPTAATAERYHPAPAGQPGPGVWAPPLATTLGRALATATLLADGRVLVAGGEAGRPLADLELYDPVAGAFSEAGQLGAPRDGHTATLLPDSGVLLLGGMGDALDVQHAPLVPETELLYPAGCE